MCCNGFRVNEDGIIANNSPREANPATPENRQERASTEVIWIYKWHHCIGEDGDCHVCYLFRPLLRSDFQLLH